MSRSARLFDLLQALRRHRHPVTAAALARELEVSTRTLYRDIATLQGQGAPIEGEAGIGYVLRPGFVLPPLMFGPDELEALMLGLRLVAEQGDPALARAAEDASARILAVLPRELAQAATGTGLLAGPSARPEQKVELALLREGIRGQRRLRMTYLDGSGTRTDRVVWPIAIAFFDQVRVLVAWCESRNGFRHFRTDRIEVAEPADRYPTPRAALLRTWRSQIGAPDRI